MQFVNACDVAKAHVAILERVEGSDRFILGGHYYSWFDLLEIIKRLTGRQLFSVQRLWYGSGLITGASYVKRKSG